MGLSGIIQVGALLVVLAWSVHSGQQAERAYTVTSFEVVNSRRASSFRSIPSAMIGGLDGLDGCVWGEG